nr:hypothetical protein [Tanacetum cinerariifolium]
MFFTVMHCRELITSSRVNYGNVFSIHGWDDLVYMLRLRPGMPLVFTKKLQTVIYGYEWEFALLVKIILSQRCINVSQRHINNNQQSCDSYARMVPAAAKVKKRLLSATITLIFKAGDPTSFSFIKWYQSLVRSFDQEKNNIQAQQKKKMVKTSSSSENKPCCSKACKKNTEILNSKITQLTDKLSDRENMLYHYKLGLAQVEERLAELKNRELKYCETIRALEFKVESSTNCIESLRKDLELLKKEKGEIETKLTGFQTASKDLDSLLESQRLDKNKEGLGYSVVPPFPARLYSPPKKDLSWTGLPEFKDDTVTDYSRPSPTIESSSDDAQNRNSSVTKTEASHSTISFKPFIKFVKAADRPTEDKTDKEETVKKPTVKYAELYRRTSNSSKVKGNQMNWNNLKSQQLGENFVKKKRLVSTVVILTIYLMTVG